MKTKDMDMEFINNPDSLVALLNVAEPEDLGVLVDYITDKGEGRVALSDDVCKRLLQCQAFGEYSDLDRIVIGNEIRLFGGNTFSNLYRDIRTSLSYGSILDKILPDTNALVQYPEIVRDVASHLKVAYNKSSSVPMIEDGIVRKLLADSFEKMTPEERSEMLEALNIADIGQLRSGASAAVLGLAKAGGFTTYKITLIVANALSKAIRGVGFSFTGNMAITRALKLAIGPVGWVISGIWTIADMASPAYRVTMPCVVQIALIRQKALAAVNAKECKTCHSLNAKDAKFCGECGAAMKGRK